MPGFAFAFLRPRPAGPIDRAMLAAAGWAVVGLEDGSDQAMMALVANADVATVEHLLSDLDPQMYVRRSRGDRVRSAAKGRASGPLRPIGVKARG